MLTSVDTALHDTAWLTSWLHMVHGECIAVVPHCMSSESNAQLYETRLSVRLLLHEQALSEGSAALGQLPRDVRQQVEAHRKAGGVQHLLDLLRQIQVTRCSSVSGL